MFWPFILVADLAGTLVVADRSEARTRTTQGAPLGYDLSTRPSARLEANDRRFAYGLGYAVTLTAPDLELGFTPEVLHNGSLGVAWHDRTSTLSLSEDATYGEQNFSYLNPTQPVAGQPLPAVQLLPAPQTILFGATRTALTATARPWRRWRFSSGLSYTRAGGLDSASRTVVPLQASQRADLAVGREMSRVDVLTTSVWAAQTTISATTCVTNPVDAASNTLAPICSPREVQVEVAEGWSHRFARSHLLTLSVGAEPVWARSRPQDPFRFTVYPVADLRFEASARPRGGDGVAYSVDARLAPVIDFRNGVLDQRAQLVGSAAVVHDRTTGAAQLSGTQSIPPGDFGASTFVSGSVEVRYRVSDAVDVSGGTRGAWQNEVPFGAFFSTVEFVTLTVHAQSRL